MLRNCCKEVWYIMFTMLISTTKKYKMLPRVATGRNSSRASLILISVSLATNSFSLTSWAVSFVVFNTVTSDSSSTREPCKQSVTLLNIVNTNIAPLRFGQSLLMLTENRCSQKVSICCFSIFLHKLY